jgi:membrane-associated protease RseP (regulator of RpoE activity)
VENNKTKGKLSALWAFLFGIIIMLCVYVLFESAPNRLRSGSTNDTTSITTNVVKTANISQTDAVEDVSVRPSVFLGVEVISVNAIIAEQLSLPAQRGVLVNGVVDGSPAQEAGLLRGDCLISLDGKAIDDIGVFRQLLAAYNPGDKVRIAYIRNTQKDRVYVQLVGLPGSPATDQDNCRSSAKMRQIHI